MPEIIPTAFFERTVAGIGNLARPSVLYIAAWSAGVATVRLAFSDGSWVEKAAFIAAAWTGVAALYGAKALEEGRKAKVDGEVAIAQAPTNQPPKPQARTGRTRKIEEPHDRPFR